MKKLVLAAMLGMCMVFAACGSSDAESSDTSTDTEVVEEETDEVEDTDDTSYTIEYDTDEVAE